MYLPRPFLFTGPTVVKSSNFFIKWRFCALFKIHSIPASGRSEPGSLGSTRCSFALVWCSTDCVSSSFVDLKLSSDIGLSSVRQVCCGSTVLQPCMRCLKRLTFRASKRCSISWSFLKNIFRKVTCTEMFQIFFLNKKNVLKLKN